MVVERVKEVLRVWLVLERQRCIRTTEAVGGCTGGGRKWARGWVTLS